MFYFVHVSKQTIAFFVLIIGLCESKILIEHQKEDNYMTRWGNIVFKLQVSHREKRWPPQHHI